MATQSNINESLALANRRLLDLEEPVKKTMFVMNAMLNLVREEKSREKTIVHEIDIFRMNVKKMAGLIDDLKQSSGNREKAVIADISRINSLLKENYSTCSKQIQPFFAGIYGLHQYDSNIKSLIEGSIDFFRVRVASLERSISTPSFKKDEDAMQKNFKKESEAIAKFDIFVDDITTLWKNKVVPKLISNDGVFGTLTKFDNAVSRLLSAKDPSDMLHAHSLVVNNFELFKRAFDDFSKSSDELVRKIKEIVSFSQELGELVTYQHKLLQEAQGKIRKSVEYLAAHTAWRT